MDPVFLARLQFAITIGFHFIFPPISIGLAWMLVIIEGMAWRKKSDVWERMGVFYGKLLAITFAVGVATGIVMEFQFGTNWASYSRFVGDIFGAPLAAEGVFAFFLESSFLGLYLFGRGRVTKGTHWFSILMVAVGATISAFWILVANSWQQTPDGFILQNGRAELTSFAAAVFTDSMWPRFFHTMTASLITGAFFVAGTSALLLLRKQSRDVALPAIKLALGLGLVFSIMAAMPTGHIHASQVARTQPEKFAALEGLYTAQDKPPLVVFALPKTDPPDLLAELEIPGLLGWLAFGDPDAKIKSLADFPADEVPKGGELWLTFVSFHNMVLLGGLFVLMTSLGVFLVWRKKLETTPLYLWALVCVSPLPVAACQFGWVATEVGRQPWIVYKLLRTQEAASVTVGAGEILFSIILFSLVYIALGSLWVFLLLHKVRIGPKPGVASEREVA